MTEFVRVYDKTTGRKLGLRPKSWLTIFPNIAQTPAAKARRSPKKKSTATPAAELSSEATDVTPEEEK